MPRAVAHEQVLVAIVVVIAPRRVVARGHCEAAHPQRSSDVEEATRTPVVVVQLVPRARAVNDVDIHVAVVVVVGPGGVVRRRGYRRHHHVLKVLMRARLLDVVVWKGVHPRGSIE